MSDRSIPLSTVKKDDVLLEHKINPVAVRIRLIAIRLALFAVLLALWEAGVRYKLIDSFFTSQPSMIFQRLYEWAVGGQLVQHVPITILEAFLGFVIGTAVGGIVGFIFGWFEKVADLLDPFIIAIYSLPKVALAPLFILWFGIGIETKIILTATIVFFLVFYNTYAGVRDVSRELVDIVRLMGAGTLQVLWRVVLPSAMTVIFVGLRVSVPYALIGAVVGEMMASNRGIGFLLTNSTGQFDTAGAFAALVLLVIISTFLNGMIVALEKYLLRWKKTQR
ncbi:MAG: NitT/TauT family transport system permease protein [Alphaproteobacteria bacterium]|jgi:NitT/TauT family transport system permease protein|nr:NitT/TauT family transport system permease protein [Alphaproteobacteria bacterium]